jgi:hypothetical protein
MTPTAGGTLASSGNVTVNSGSSVDQVPANNTASATTTVSDFAISVDPPASVSIPAGQPASYTIRITPNSAFPNSISLSCSSGLPTGARCETFSTNPIPAFTNTSPVTSVLTISTTAAVTTAQSRDPRTIWKYALCLPIFGVTLLGAGGSKRRRKLAIALLLLVLLGVIGMQAACSSDKSAPAPSADATPPGTYTITVAGTSGSFTRSATITLVVQ